MKTIVSFSIAVVGLMALWSYNIDQAYALNSDAINDVDRCASQLNVMNPRESLLLACDEAIPLYKLSCEQEPATCPPGTLSKINEYFNMRGLLPFGS